MTVYRTTIYHLLIIKINRIPLIWCRIFCLAFFSFMLSSEHANGQLVINEFMASNLMTVTDPVSGKYSDWIELYNTGNTPIELKGYFITDNLNNPAKWEIDTEAIIPAGGYILIWADGDSAGLHLPFKLAQEGEEIGLYSPQGVLLDTFTYGIQFPDISYGRQTDGSSYWGFFQEPTPGSSNNTTVYTGVVDNIPEFSTFGGLYNTPQQVRLSSPFGGTIRYTTDGSDPDEYSPAYSGTIHINTTTVLRARVFKPGLIPGRIITNSYFINEGLEERGLPVFSIATNPENFWDPEIGIYVQNFKPDWEVPINIELFENNGSDRAAFNEPAGTKVNGLYSWQLPQKMLGVYFRKQYGTSRLEYPLIFDRERTGYETFALRASGNDWSNTLFRDGMIQTSTPFNMNLDIMGFRPSIVYVNGQYMGIHNIREKIEENYLVEHYGLEEGSFDMVEYEEYAEAGDLSQYNEFRSIYRQNLSHQSNYDQVASMMDIENFTDYIAAELYSGNYSIDHNVMTWKPKNSGKWKWILMDLDRGFIDPADYLIDFYINRDVWPLFNLMQNQRYRQYFGRRIADHMFTTFNPARIISRIEMHQQWIEKEMPHHIQRWLGTTSSYGDAIPSMEYWYDEIDKLKHFAEERPRYVLHDLRNYGFSSVTTLVLSVSPSNAGHLTFNSLKVPGPLCSGYYLKDMPIHLVAVDNPGYDFVGWAQPIKSNIITKGDQWKYLDDGSDQGTAWHDTTFNDDSWKTGSGEFGYGDGGEATVIDYGSDANNKYITTYFRKSFSLTQNDLCAFNFEINILYDDGAIVFLNGKEILHPNMSTTGTIGYHTLAISSISDTGETTYYSYPVDPSYFKAGNNLLAVEVHQSAANSSDLSFDLELIMNKPQTENFVSVSREYTLTLTGAYGLTAVYEANGECVIPEIISDNLTLSKECSPYVAQGDIVVDSNVTLTIEPGVEIRMAEHGNMFIYGNLQAHGTESERILFTINPEYSGSEWGALCFMNNSSTSDLSYTTVKNASKGPDPVRQSAAISGFFSDLQLDHLIIDSIFQNPILGRYSDITLTNSFLHSDITGDLINVKYGHARVENCEFQGNVHPDADAIDYDDVEDGVIRNCKIHSFYGLNCDAIDIGENAVNIAIDSLIIYNITDKGISVGQQSSATIRNCTFLNCNLGLGLKDSCKVTVDHCTFYGVCTPIACFEKNPGSAGGNAIVKNSILSNSYDNSIFADGRSRLNISYSLSDNDSLPEDGTNIFGNPGFENPSQFDFDFNSSSPCIIGGNDHGIPAQLGSLYRNTAQPTSLMFNNIFCNADNSPGKTEFLSIFNSSSQPVNLLNYKITSGIDVEFTEPVIIEPLETIYLVKDMTLLPDDAFNEQVFQWTSGTLANEGEAIRIVDNYGIILDQVKYSALPPWPDYSSESGTVLSLISPDLDNHFAESWKTINYYDIIHRSTDSTNIELTIYPNPSEGIFVFMSSAYANSTLSIYSMTGQLCMTIAVDEDGYAVIDLTRYEGGLYLIKAGNIVRKILLLSKWD